MPVESDEHTPSEVIAHEKKAYLKEVPEPESEWPSDVKAVYNEVRGRFFELGLEVQSIIDTCGIGDNNIRTRFDHFTGHGIKELILLHRLELAKRLLRDDRVPIGKIALAVGYRNPSGFSATFKRWEECTPSAYRTREEG